MTDYTPDTEEVRELYWAVSGDPRRDSKAWAEFDRWFQKVKADMIRELIIRGPKEYYDLDLYGHVGAEIPVRWLEDEADRVQG